jgi:hypothetical protein
MWLFTKYGFFSAVCARKGKKGKKGKELDPNLFMIRARIQEHLEALIERFEELADCKIKNSNNTDYRFRIFVPKETWAVVMAALTLEIEYGNFKSAVHATQPHEDGGYTKKLHDVWSVMYGLQTNNYGAGIYSRPKYCGGNSQSDNANGSPATEADDGGTLSPEYEGTQPESTEDVILVLNQETGSEVVIIWWPELFTTDEEAYATAITDGDAEIVANPEFSRHPWHECAYSHTPIFDAAYSGE